jgi:hypothetical protein
MGAPELTEVTSWNVRSLFCSTSLGIKMCKQKFRTVKTSTK